ncbi:MAG TPA: hypothetical protein VFV67_32105 [Actinophytocola sp.]|uniref:magnesium transporter MgtE N-terminal domain-containing protein n=1 Tax=Actinophytocola sp. TaxID=1872138 RepID=UPI002DBF118A|nr:hypothetical protein [Actinophytocola sp.]HEU5475310.1 hypothetical protein [Actinophytocola sp.]
MVQDQATQAELAKLARVLGTTPDRVAFAESLDHTAIRSLRDRVAAALYDEHRAGFRRIARVARVLPTPLNVKITMRSFPPRLAARIASEMAPDRAAELANRMPIDYLAEGCLHLDPHRAAPLISRIRPDRMKAVVTELVRRGEYITLGHLLDAAADRAVRLVAATISDDALLRIGYYTESTARLTQAVAALPLQRLPALVHHALTGPRDLRSAGLALIQRIDDDNLRGRLADYAAQADDDTLTTLLRTAIDDNCVPQLLTAVAAMRPASQQRVLTLPALAEPDILSHLINAAATHNLATQLAPMMNRIVNRFRLGSTAHRETTGPTRRPPEQP